MAKRKKIERKAQPEVIDGLTSFQLRLDSRVHEKLKTEAQRSGISLNQLMRGILRWASGRIQQGRAELENRRISSSPSPERVWFGEPTRDPGMGDPGTVGRFFFQLDFSDETALVTILQEGAVIDGKRYFGNESIDDGEPSWEHDAFKEEAAKSKRTGKH